VLRGAQLATALQEHDLVDEYALFVHPAALGGGVPFFRRTVGLKLHDVRRFELGVLGLRYSSVSGASTP
jgi:riboflavin biosynthesis pyrimidine reductase